MRNVPLAARRRCILPLLMVSPLILTACGGDGADVSASGAPGLATQVGQFIDGPVVGLRYTTATHAGETNTEGEFLYEAGETVRFAVGDIVLGEASGAQTISPFDLVGMTPPTAGIDVINAVRDMQRRKINKATSLEEATNLAVFLQTLDADGDPTNGVQIPPAIHNLTSGLPVLNFAQPAYVFHHDFALRMLMSRGHDAGLWPGGRAIKRPGLALDALYAGLNLAPEIFYEASIDYDADGDGRADQHRAWTYDANGLPASYEEDNNGDGAVDVRGTTRYDANGDIALDEHDNNGDGLVDTRAIYSYDARGRLVSITYDNNGDTTIDRIDSRQYDAYGNETLREIDSNADGAVDTVEKRVFDASGNMTMLEVDNMLTAVTPDRRVIYAYTNRRETLREEDDDADGTPERRITSAYDADGNLTLNATDNDVDGFPDVVERMQYDANGHQTRYESDADNDGFVDARITRVYDSSGNFLSEERDNNADGTIDERRTFAYDSNGLLVREEHDYDGDGVVDRRIANTYDAKGFTTRSEDDMNADGTIDHATTFTPIAAGRWSHFFER